MKHQRPMCRCSFCKGKMSIIKKKDERKRIKEKCCICGKMLRSGLKRFIQMGNYCYSCNTKANFKSKVFKKERSYDAYLDQYMEKKWNKEFGSMEPKKGKTNKLYTITMPNKAVKIKKL